MALTRQAPAAPAAADEAAVWPNRGPYQQVGRPDKGYTVKLPVAVIAALRPLLGEEPSQWGVLRAEDYSGRGQRVLQVSVTEKYVNLLATVGSWVNLGVPAGVPFLNQVLERLRPAALQDRRQVERYLEHIIRLHRYGGFVILTPELQRQRFTDKRLIDLMNYPEKNRQELLAKEPELKQVQIDTWLGTEKSRQVLFALFHEVELTRAEDRVTARCNIMNFFGAVEQWTFHLRADRVVELENIDIVELRKEGTFSYPLLQ